MKFTVKIPQFLVGCIIGIGIVFVVQWVFRVGFAFYLLWLFSHP